MGLYDAFKDVMTVAQKADNIELYRQLLDLSAQALDMQAEIVRLKEENDELRKNKNIDDDIEYFCDPFIMRKSDKKSIKYCAACWASKRNLVPIQLLERHMYMCPLCKIRIFDYEEK